MFTFTDYSPDGSGLPIDGSGFVTIEFDFVPELHVPLQQPSVTATLGSEGISAVVEYSAASPSLTGSYVLCSRSDVPFMCGGRISLTVTGVYILLARDCSSAGIMIPEQYGICYNWL